MKCLFNVVLTVLLFNSTYIGCKSQVGPVSIDSIIEATTKHNNTLESASGEFTVYTQYSPTVSKERSDRATESNEIVQWAYKNNKTYRKSTNISEGPNAVDHTTGKPIRVKPFWQIELFDGKRQYTISDKGSGTTYANVVDNRKNCDCPMAFGYWSGTEWISDVLKHGKFQVIEQSQDPQFGSICGIAGTDAKGNNIKLWFARDKDWIVTRSETKYTGTDNTVTKRILSLQTASGIWVPQAAIKTVNNGTSNIDESTYKFGKTVFNNVSDSVVEYKPSPGSRLYDQDANVGYVVNGVGKLKMVESQLGGTPPYSRIWAFFASITCLVFLGVRTFRNWRLKSRS